MRVLNFGSLNLDYVYQVGHFVQPGETLSAVSQTVNPGGKGLNQSIALAKAGAEVCHAGCIGKGGENLRELLKENGVNTEYLREVPALQGNAVIQVNPEGQNCILLFGGSNQCITEEQIDQTIKNFAPGDWLVLQNEINSLPRIVDAGHDQGMKIVLNPSPFNEKLSEVNFGKLTWLLVNEIEAEQLSGSREPEKAWLLLHEKYPSLSLLVTLGSDGCTAYTKRETVYRKAYPVMAVDTTAAGDTFTGYFVAGLMEGQNLRDCMSRAGMAAAISVTRPGAAPSIPGRKEVEKELEKRE